MDDNPNEYDEDGFCAASDEADEVLPAVFMRLWKTGARRENIVERINTALEMAEIPNHADSGPLQVSDR